MSSRLHVELMVTSGQEIGRRYALRLGQTFVLGRSRKVAIRIDDAMASRQHASVELRPSGLFVTDLGSSNGTLVDGRRLEPNTPFDASNSDTIQIGEHSLRIDYDDEDNQQTLSWQSSLPLLPEQEFQVLGLIAKGATGAIYSAEQKLLHRQVAIKVLTPDVGSDSQRERFIREGWLSSQIESPHVVHVYDVRVVKGQTCLVMELVQGPSALDRLRDGPLPVVEALRIAESVALGLQAAADAGIVHRDIKPSNILLDPAGIAKLSDFGLAKAIEESGPEPNPQIGVGTLAYVAPEQAVDARNSDHRSDLYALGATLYHLLSGRPPFEPQSVADLLECLDGAPPRLDTYSLPEQPPLAVLELLYSLLAKDPELRPGPANTVARRLRQIRLDHFPDAPMTWGTTRSQRP